jgi:hypothetical protein
MILKNIMEKVRNVWSSASLVLAGKALLFHIMLPNGAVFYRLPISAFFQERFSRSKVPDMSVDELQLWNCFSYYPSVHCFELVIWHRVDGNF